MMVNRDPKAIAMHMAVLEGPGFTVIGQKAPGKASLVR